MLRRRLRWMLRLRLRLRLRPRIPLLEEVGIRVGGERRERPGAVSARQASTRARLLLEHTSGHHASEPRRLPWLLDHRRPPAGQGAPAVLPVTQPASGALLLGANQVEHREARNEAPRHVHALLPLGLISGESRARFPAHALVHFAVAELARHAPCGHVLAHSRGRAHRLGARWARAGRHGRFSDQRGDLLA